MATATPRTHRPEAPIPVPDEPRFLIRGVGWKAYDVLVEALERAGSHVRLTYDRGDLELMSPSPEHEDAKVGLRMAFQVAAEVYGIPYKCLGSTTFRSQALDRGLEPDECFYTVNWRRISGKKRFDPDVDPAPDVVIEAEVTSSMLDRLGIYAALGVPEIWRYDGERLRFLTLQPDRTYRASDRSPMFPELDPEEILRLIAERIDRDDADWNRHFRAWVREQVDRAGRRAAAGPDPA